MEEALHPGAAGASPRVQHHWPSFRFVIPNVTWAGSKAKGEVYRNEDSLIFEFQVDNGLWKSEMKEVRVPLSEILSFSCRTGRKGRTQVVIKSVRPTALAGLPVGKHGPGRLFVPRKDRAAAKQLEWSLVQHATPVYSPPPRQGPNWPSVAFTIPELSTWGKKAKGEMYRTHDSLVIEFKRLKWGGAWWSDFKKVTIPLREIASISCQPQSWAGVPFLPKWVGRWGATQIIIKTVEPAALAELPVSKQGRGRLMVDWGDREAAQQLVASIARPAQYPEAYPARFADYRRGAEPALGHERAHPPGDFVPIARHYFFRSKVLGPALGLFLSGMIAVLTSSIWGIWYTAKTFDNIEHMALALWAFPVLAGGVLQCIGAKRMLKLESYMWALLTAILALLPWSPGWVLGLPCGIWALVVLSKPEVMAAFLGEHGNAGFVQPSRPEPSSPSPGRLGAFFRSVGRYCLTAFSGRQAVLPSSRNSTDSKDVGVPKEKSKVAETVDYTDPPAKQ
jgi:hypothetical protein